MRLMLMPKCAMELKDMASNISFRARLALQLYRGFHALLSIGAMVAAPFLSHFSRRVAEGFNDYLGRVERPKKLIQPVFWVHGVSMGESMVALGFAKELKKHFPQSTLLFTTTHPDVIKDVKKRKVAESVAYFPLDNYLSMSRIFNRWQPNAVFISETDFWPEFACQCNKRKIPLLLINGRISDKIAAFYTKARGLAEVLFGAFTAFAVQTRADADRLIEIGVPLDKINILGNMKADLTITTLVDLANLVSWQNQRDTIVFGSLHPEEFVALKPLFKRLVADKLAVVIAPRNVALSEAWKEQLEKDGFEVCLKTKIKSSTVVILDTIGELASVYDLSKVSFVGGSLDFNKTGGHNPLEVLQQRVPLLMGPYYRNFTDIVEQLKAVKGIAIVQDSQQAYEEIGRILNEPYIAQNMIAAGNSILESNRGTLLKTIQLAKKFIPK